MKESDNFLFDPYHEQVAAVSSEKSENLSGDVIDTPSPMTSLLRCRAPVVVVVCAMGHSSYVQHLLEVVRLLWDAGIKAETTYEKNPVTLIQDVQVRGLNLRLACGEVKLCFFVVFNDMVVMLVVMKMQMNYVEMKVTTSQLYG